MTLIEIPQYRWHHRIADGLMEPFMKMVTYKGDAPQRTHFWNNHKFPNGIQGLDENLGVTGVADPAANNVPYWRAHMPKFGGWKKYVVLRTFTTEPWHVLWQTPTVTGVSMVPIKGLVRCLCGPEDARFYAFDSSGKQIRLGRYGGGHIGKGGPWKSTLLL